MLSLRVKGRYEEFKEGGNRIEKDGYFAILPDSPFLTGGSQVALGSP